MSPIYNVSHTAMWQHPVLRRSMMAVISTTALLKATSQYYVDEAYFYRRCSAVCLLVGLSVTIVSRSKTAEPIDMPFWVWTRVGPGNNLLHGGPDPQCKGAILRGKRRPIVKYWDSLSSAVQNRLNQFRCRLGWTRKEACIRWGVH